MASWGTEEDDTIKRMAANGYSGTDIAAVLTDPPRSRNAVLGRAWRLGVSLNGERQPVKKPRMVSNGGKKPAQRVAKRQLTPRVPQPAKPVNVEAFEVPPLVVGAEQPAPVGLMALEEGMCKWPVGDGFCGCKTIKPGKPYCPQHTYVSKLPPPQPRERAAARQAPRNWYR